MGGSVQTQPGIRGGLNGRDRLAQVTFLVLAVACDLSFGDIRAHYQAIGNLCADRAVYRRECVSSLGTAETDNATDYRQNVAGVNNLTLTLLSAC